jgi:outer membrane protein, heavy metal efflux system
MRNSLRTFGVSMFLVACFQSFVLRAQNTKTDTVGITLAAAEQQFLAHNLQIIAQKLNVDAAKALIIQAKLYPNPNISGSIGAYNSTTKQWFPLSGTQSEQAYQVSQLIVLTHKIKKQVNIAETNYKLAEDNLYDLLRTLKLGLRSTYYNIYFLQQTAKVYDEEIQALKKVVDAYKQVVEKGYIAKSELVLIQSQLYSLQNEYQTLVDNINDQESQLRLLLQVGPTVYYRPVLTEHLLDVSPTTYGLAALLDSANANRTDLAIAKDNMLLARQTLTYQKALATPDLTVGAAFDKNGSAWTDFNAFNFGIDIPIFNRNQGNIKNAKILVDYNAANLQLTQQTVEEQIFRGLQKAIDADRLYKGIDASFAGSFDTLAKEMLDNYLKRNVNLLTFLTFYDSYKQNVVQLNTVGYNKLSALENLNFLTGTTLYNK